MLSTWPTTVHTWRGLPSASVAGIAGKLLPLSERLNLSVRAVASPRGGISGSASGTRTTGNVVVAGRTSQLRGIVSTAPFVVAGRSFGRVCAWGDAVVISVPIPAALDHTGMMNWRQKPVDRCLSDIVAALNTAGVYTSSACCGHGLEPGRIALHDGRELVVDG